LGVAIPSTSWSVFARRSVCINRPAYKKVASVYKREPNPWPVIIMVAIALIVIGAAIG